MEILSKSTKDTKELAESLAKKIKAGTVISLEGDLGAGKTTFTSYFVHALGIDKRVQSPTFVILRKYEGENLTVNHLDLYRMQGAEELLDLGLEELFEENGITLIEWPGVAEHLLPEDTIRMKFEYVDENERKISVQNLD